MVFSSSTQSLWPKTGSIWLGWYCRNLLHGNWPRHGRCGYHDKQEDQLCSLTLACSCKFWKAATKGSWTWVPCTHKGNLDCVSSTWIRLSELQPCRHLRFKHSLVLIPSSPLFLSGSQNKQWLMIGISITLRQTEKRIVYVTNCHCNAEPQTPAKPMACSNKHLLSSKVWGARACCLASLTPGTG